MLRLYSDNDNLNEIVTGLLSQQIEKDSAVILVMLSECFGTIKPVPCYTQIILCDLI